MADLSEFKKIANTLNKLGFSSSYQAGTPSKIHELNLIVENPIQDRLYWITKSFGEFLIIYRNEIDNTRAKQYRVKCKNQKEVCENFTKLVLEERRE